MTSSCNGTTSVTIRLWTHKFNIHGRGVYCGHFADNWVLCLITSEPRGKSSVNFGTLWCSLITDFRHGSSASEIKVIASISKHTLISRGNQPCKTSRIIWRIIKHKFKELKCPIYPYTWQILLRKQGSKSKTWNENYERSCRHEDIFINTITVK